MIHQWRDLVGSVVDGKYPLVEYLGDVAGNGVFATEPIKSIACIIRLAPSGTADAQRMLEQWQASAELSDPHVARTFGAGETEVIGKTVVFTVTERPDDSLAEAVRNRPLTSDEARSLSSSMLGGLDYLHRKGFAHGAVSPDNIVAMGDKIKLAPWTIARATSTQMADDVAAAGQTIVEVLTQKRPATETAIPKLAQPFTNVARACMRKSVGAGEALRMLKGEAAPAVEPAPRKSYKLPTAAIVAASVAVLLLILGVRSYKQTPQQAAPAQALPSPVSAVVREPSAPAPVAPAPDSKGDWVVVAEIYKQHNQAIKHAERIAAKWKQWKPEVYPPQPDGRRFMVVLGFADTRKEGEQLLAKARSAGMPRKVYLTKLKQ